MRWRGSVALMFLAAGCGGGASQVAGPSAVGVSAAEPAATTVVAVMVGEGVLLKAEGLRGAHQVEGSIRWEPATLRYQSFDQGRWWFSGADWEWVMVPDEGGTYWGVWRGQAASGDGVLGLIKLQGMPDVTELKVWVDGVPVRAVADHRSDGRADASGGLVPAAGTLGGSRGTGDHHWSLGPLQQPPG